MDFVQAVQTCLSKYVTFSGRAQRSEFWYFVLFSFLSSIVASLFDGMIFGFNVEGNEPFGSIVGLFLFLPSISAAVRRLHDTDRSGWWWWLWLIPLIGWIILLVWFVSKGTTGPNQYGHDPLDGPHDLNGPTHTHRSSIPAVSRDD